MASGERLLRAHRTVLLAPIVEIGGVVNILGGTPTVPILQAFPGQGDTIDVDILNTWQGVVSDTSANAGVGGNISCAILDDLELGLADSDTDDELTICSIGNEQTLTTYNVNANFTFMRDESTTDTGVYNLAWNLVKAPDIRYAVIDRIQGGKTSTDAFAAGDIVSVYEVRTDNPVDITDDGASIKVQQNFIPSGLVAVNIDVAA